MLIKYHLQGYFQAHKGVFDTTGFWCKWGFDIDDVTRDVIMYKLWSHFSFDYAHVQREIVDEVFEGLIAALGGQKVSLANIGYFTPIT